MGNTKIINICTKCHQQWTIKHIFPLFNNQFKTAKLFQVIRIKYYRFIKNTWDTAVKTMLKRSGYFNITANCSRNVKIKYVRQDVKQDDTQWKYKRWISNGKQNKSWNRMTGLAARVIWNGTTLNWLHRQIVSFLPVDSAGVADSDGGEGDVSAVVTGCLQCGSDGGVSVVQVWVVTRGGHTQASQQGGDCPQDPTTWTPKQTPYWFGCNVSNLGAKFS